ncbi:MAG: ADP-ribosyltransferase [Methanimicrococcus sp.]|nr:ADP-ribosyltransferase [Methanimicrococcus sp.]
MIESNIQNIDSAIQKSKADREYTIYRGIKDTDWLKEKYIGGTFTEKAFGSFTLDVNKALEYSNFENPIVLHFEIKKGMNVLYMDENESEMLLPRDLTYKIKKIEKIYLEEGRKGYIAYYIILKTEENEKHAI